MENDFRFAELITKKQTCTLANLGKDTVMRLAKEANAIVRIGRSVRIIRKKFFDYLEEKYCSSEILHNENRCEQTELEEVREEENGRTRMGCDT